MIMIYLNNSATSYPKPESVIRAVARAMEKLPPGQYRSAASSGDQDLLPVCRERLGSLLGIGKYERIYFTSGSTEGLNAIIAGLGIKAEEVITTVTEHNSVLRPLYNLPGIAGEPVLLPCDRDGLVSPELFEKEAAKGRARAVILNHCSNVTGAVQDAAAIGEIARRYGMYFILDVSQSAGCMEVKADEWGVDALAFTGHKSLMGPQGTGGFYFREGIALRPYKYGGTGYDSRRIIYDDEEYEYETGTQNGPGIAGLAATALWVAETGTERIALKEQRLAERLTKGLASIRGIHIYGQGLAVRGPVVSFDSDKLPPADLAYILQNSYDIVTRAGLHCAPLIHEYTGSGEKGTLRVSFSYFNTDEDVDELICALKEILLQDMEDRHEDN